MRLYGYDSSQLALHEALAQSLQVGINTQLKVAAGTGALVVLTVLILALYAAMGITKQDLNAFLPAQILLIGTLNARLADIIARLIIVVQLYIALRGLSHIAQDMGRDGTLILSHAATLHVEARKTI